MTGDNTAAGRAYGLALAQLERLRSGDLDAYLSAENELDSVYRLLLDPQSRPASGDVDDEAVATTRELVHLQSAICDRLGELVERAADAVAKQRRRSAAIGAYGASTAARLPSRG